MSTQPGMLTAVANSGRRSEITPFNFQKLTQSTSYLCFFLQEQGKQLFAKSCMVNMTLLLQIHDLTDDEGKPDRS